MQSLRQLVFYKLLRGRGTLVAIMRGILVMLTNAWHSVLHQEKWLESELLFGQPSTACCYYYSSDIVIHVSSISFVILGARVSAYASTELIHTAATQLHA